MLKWLELSRLPLKPRAKLELLNRFGDPEQALKYVGSNPRLHSLFEKINKYSTPEDDLKKIEEIGAGIITICDDIYPETLKNTYNPPIVLYYLGNLELLNLFKLGVVGTRKPTRYGYSVARNLVLNLVKANIGIVSGLAIGCDAIAHKTALDYSGATIAVLGTGIDVIYPASNRSIFNKIKEHGLIITEYPVGTPSLPKNFPLRNRIISGISKGVLVIEAGSRSGSLITAYYALNQNREVFAVPGNIFHNNSEGCHLLIQQGAKLVKGVEDILDEFNEPGLLPEPPSHENMNNLNCQEKAILEILENESREIDFLVEKLTLPTGKLLSLLTRMELKGLIIKTDGSKYGKSK